MDQDNGASNQTDENAVIHSSGVKSLHGKNGGSVPRLTKALAKEIANTIASSTLPVSKLCELNPHWPQHSQLIALQDKYQWWSDAFWTARRKQTDFLVHDNVNLQQDLLQNQEKKSMAAVQANKIVMEDRRWMASRLLREKYGDEPVTVQNAVSVQVSDQQLADLRSRLETARKLTDNGNEKATGKGLPGKSAVMLTVDADPEPQYPDTGSGTGTVPDDG
jgi:Bacteriophage Sf6, terminase small subunit-like